VRFESASISVPAGWVAHRRDTKDLFAEMPTLCLAPADFTVNPKVSNCPVLLAPLNVDWGVDANTGGGYRTDPSWCAAASPLYHSYREQSADESFGGRTADWRRWEIECTAGGSWHIEQYVVPTGPGYVMYSQHADASVHAAMEEIATNSHLPSRTAPIRLWDEGYLRSVDRTASGVRITLDRIAFQDGKLVNSNPRTYGYLVPTAVFNSWRGGPSIGTLIYLASDGNKITQMSVG
jgi:hypothetical protein